jgi:hypothetical protein
MSNPAVVILTDPGRCQLAEAETLVQALLQVQQLNQAGVPASQALCDHPAAAMDFIDAYAKAYPALQLQTSDLPLPQHLYSMVADGRLSPLQPVEPAEAAKLEQPAPLYPLYVLSLGAPEALMQALQHNSLAKSSIRVLEIAPIEQARAEPVSVAEAVAAAPLARSSWLSESSSAPERHDAAASGTEPLADDPVELAGVEVDLDRIQIESARDRQSYQQSDRMLAEPAPAAITAVAGAEPGSSGVGRQTMAEAPGSSIGMADPASAPAAAAAPPFEPVADARPAPPADLAGTSMALSEVSPVAAESPSDDGADTPVEPDASDAEPSDAPVGEPGGQDLIAGSDGHPRPAPARAKRHPDVDDAASAGPSTREGDDGDAPADRSCTFSSPGEDVVYRPTASFSGSDDLAYALPTEDPGEPGSFAGWFDLAEGADVVDPEAMYRDLSEAGAEGSTALQAFDFILMRVPDATRADSQDARGAYAKCAGSVAQRSPEPDDDEPVTNPLTTVHDSDV